LSTQRTRMASVRTGTLAPVAAAGLLVAIAGAGCQPTVKVEAPDKPITINLNVKIEQEVRIKIEKDAEQLLNQKKELF